MRSKSAMGSVGLRPASAASSMAIQASASPLSAASAVALESRNASVSGK